MLNDNSESLESYCGSCCSVCGLYQGRVKKTVEDMRKVISTYGFDKIALELVNYEPAFQNYAEFNKVLESIDRLVRNLADCPGCVAGGGDPNCVVRECCKRKPHLSCVECVEMDVCKEMITTPLFQHRFKALKAALRLNL